MKPINCLSAMVLLLLLGASCISQKQKCSCNSVLFYKQTEIPIFHENGNFTTIINDTIEENYYTVYIMSVKGKKAYVSASKILHDTIPKIGWIETKYLGIYATDWTNVKLYSHPNINSKVKSIIIRPEWYPFNILKCKGNWLYVSYLDGDGVIKEGWLPPDNQCSNPYSTCN